MHIFRIAFAALCLLILPSVFAADANDDKVTLNFVNADIEAVVKSIGQITGRNFLLDPRVKGTVNIVSASPIPRELTYQILLSALRLQGFAAIEGAGVTKIVYEQAYPDRVASALLAEAGVALVGYATLEASRT